MSRDLDEQDRDFFDRARRNPLRSVDFEYARLKPVPMPTDWLPSLVQFGEELDGEEIEVTLP